MAKSHSMGQDNPAQPPQSADLCAARLAARVMALPCAALAPVVNPPRKGRYPHGVESLAQARRERIWREQKAARRESATQADANPNPLMDAMLLPAGLRGLPVGTQVINQRGEAVTVVEPYKLRVVRVGGECDAIAGYICEKESGERFFYTPGNLTDPDGYVTHLQLVK